MPRPTFVSGAVLLALLHLGSGLEGSLLLAQDQGSRPDYSAEIRRTSYGVPHIEAADLGSLGFGAGYAFAEDNVCVLADMVLTVDGRRSLHHGDVGQNVATDLFFSRLKESGEIEAILASPDGPSSEARALAAGYAAGFSHYLRETGVDELPDPRCRGAEWVREISEMDVWRLSKIRSTTMLAGIVAAAPPGPGQPLASLDDPLPNPESLGSNAYAIGSEFTQRGRGVLLANPHYPWDGINRFYRQHLTIPGQLNVAGAAILGSPFVGIGHTERIAWTHTVSTAVRYGLFELTLSGDDPTTFILDGRSVPMTTQTVRVPVRQEDGGVMEVEHTFHATFLGPVVHTETYPWTHERAFVLATPEAGLRSFDQYLAISRSSSVRELRDALLRWQATGFNTTAVDDSGEALYGDLGAVPHVTDEHAVRCLASDTARRVWERARIPVLDGSRSECHWGSDPEAVAPGLFGPRNLPQIVRRDFVGQFNDSYWLTNPSAPIEQLPRILGEERTERSLRTRLGIRMVQERVRGEDGLPGSKFDLESLWTIMFNDRNLGAEMTRDDLVDACRAKPSVNVEGQPVDLIEACDVLARWDLRVDRDSRGAHLFREFARAGGLVFAVPFDPARPVETPHTLDVDDPRVLTALGEAVLTLAGSGIRLDAPLGVVQTEPRGILEIPIHGGPGGEGIFNVITAPFVENVGYPKVVHGSSFVMVVEFTDAGPRSRAILTYSQSTNPTSPHSADQTLLYSQKGWDDMRFTEDEIEADPALRVYTVSSSH